MNLKILLPSGLFAEESDVTRIVAESPVGSFGLLPQRLDCVAPLVAGILAYDRPDGGEAFVGIDEGVLVKTGADVRVSVRRAITGADLTHLRQAMQAEFLARDEQEKDLRSKVAKLESGLVRSLMKVHD